MIFWIFFFTDRVIAIVEWAEHLSAKDMPEEYISLTWTALEPERTVLMQAHGMLSQKVLALTLKELCLFSK